VEILEDDRDRLTTHYEQQIKKLTENLTTAKMLQVILKNVKNNKTENRKFKE
jgi:hypothetical protein